MANDIRYKVTQEDVNVMRELNNKGYSYSKIALLFPITAQTVRYWCDEEDRKKQRLKNARRRHKPLDKKRIERITQKRKELRQDDRFKTRISFQSAKDEMRAKRKTARDYRTGKRVPLNKALKILNTKELHLGNAKID